MHLSQLFFHMLTVKALTKLNVTDNYGSDHCFYESVSLIHMRYTSTLCVSEQQCWVSLRTAAYCWELASLKSINDLHISA